MENLTNTSRPLTETLRSLQQELQNTLLLTGTRLEGKQYDAPNSNSGVVTPSLNLPLPEDIDNAFEGFSVSPQALAQLNLKYRLSIQQIQQIHCHKFEEACRDLGQLPQSNNAYSFPLLLEGLRKVYEASYRKRYLPMFKDQILDLRSKLNLTSGSKKVPFNAEYTPLLETYFARNAYPSAPDRQVLAKKTAMTARQIEVWFQNHRKRAKENGRTLNRMGPNAVHGLFPISGTHNQSKVLTVSENNSVPASDEIRASPNKAADIFSISSATTTSHCFPSPFSPSTTLFHFHTDNAFTFPPPVWPRTPCSQSVSRSDTNFDDFISTFASKLNIRDGVSKSKRKSLFRSQTHVPWFFATTTIASNAPHPAFIGTSKPSTPPTQVIKAPSAAYPQPPIPQYVPPSVALPRSLKKAAPFPKRYPSKYHPYSHISTSTPPRSSGVYSVRSTTSFASRASAMRSMPSRASNDKVTDSTSHPVSWVMALEVALPPGWDEPNLPFTNRATTVDYTPPASRATSINSLQSSGQRVSSSDSTTSSTSRVTSFESDSSFGSRTSSLSSIESPFPPSPTLQPQVDDTLFLEHQDLQFLGDISDFDQLMTGNTQLSSEVDNPFSSKLDGMFGYAFPYLQNTLSSFPMNFIQTLS